MSVSTDFPTETDSILLERCLHQKDRLAFTALVERYQNLVCSVAYNILGDIGQSEDVAQESFVAAWKKLDSLRDLTRFRSWLCGIARNIALGVVRKRKPECRPTPEDLAATEASEAGPDEIAVSNEEEALIWDALESLPETYREPLILFYREEQSIARVASDLNLSEDAVKQRLSRGRGMLRDQMLDLIEGILTTTRPGTAFTLAVMGALPGVMVTSAAAATATAGSLGTAGKVSASAAATTAVGGAVAGMLGGLLGGFLGWFVSDQTARHQSQRDLMKRGFLVTLLLVGIFMIPWIAMGFGWWHPSDLAPGRYILLWSLWMFGFFAAIGGWSWWLGCQSRKLRKQCEEAEVEELPLTPVRSWLQKWEGRRWNSRASLFGFPLVSIAFSDPDRDFSGYQDGAFEGQQTAKGWIAMGDRAIGLIAFGNFAFGGIAIGSMSLGVISFGGLAAGGIALGGLTLAGVSLGGLALGGASFGGLAVGWWAFGGAAIAWRAAVGGYALAHDYALGGAANALHANSEIARTFIEGHPVFTFGQHYLELLQHSWAIPVLFTVTLGGVALSLLIGFRRKRPDTGEG